MEIMLWILFHGALTAWYSCSLTRAQTGSERLPSFGDVINILGAVRGIILLSISVPSFLLSRQF